jgi:NitT/TauT family transport system ATP-binding protein
MPYIQVRNVAKTYNNPNKNSEVKALQGLNFEIESGEFVTFIGPSGCGKTTMLHIIAGLEKQTSGTVEIEKKTTDGMREDVGIIFQEVDRTLFPWRTVLGNVEFGLEMRSAKRNSPELSKKERKEAAIKYIHSVGLEGFEYKHPYELSGGMRQRLSIARLLAYDPGILLMDEPFTNLDAQTRSILQEDLVKLWLTTEKTILFVTHDIEEAIYIGSRILIMTARPGKIREEFLVNSIYPRDYHFRISPEFNKLKSSILQILKEEVTNSGYNGKCQK